MKLKFKPTSIPKFLYHHLAIVLVVVIIVVINWLAFFTYSNLYTTVISPREIKDTEIVSRKQKVDLELFNTINERINNKKEVSSRALLNIKNPFK